jgi:hypothetical protein
MKYTLSDAIHKLVPDAEFVITGDSLEGLVFIKPEDATKPTQEEIQTVLNALQNDFSSKKAAAQAKLTALGLTEDDLKALGL